MNIQDLSDQQLVKKALVRTGGNQSRLARLMCDTGVQITQVTIHRYTHGKPIVRQRAVVREWLTGFVARTSETFRVSEPRRNGRRK